jgi:hypothetical protein
LPRVDNRVSSLSEQFSQESNRVLGTRVFISAGTNFLAFRHSKIYIRFGPAEHIFFSKRVLAFEPPFRKSSKPVGGTAAMPNAGVPLKVQQRSFGRTGADMSLLCTESGVREERRAIEQLLI